MEQAKQGRRSEQEIFELLEEFDKSGALTVKEFCEMNEISTATFYNWHKLYKSKTEGNQQSGFVSLEVNTPVPQPESPVLFAEVKGIKLYRSVTASYLKELAQ